MADERYNDLSDYVDGKTAALHQVDVRISANGLVIRGAHVSAFWPADGLEIVDSPDSERILRLAHRDYPAARLTLADTALMDQIHEVFPSTVRERRDGRRRDLKRVFWAGGVTISLALVFFLALPGIVSTLAALVPYTWEKRLGESAFGAFSQVIDGVDQTCSSAEGQAALERLTERLTTDMGLSGPVDIRVVPVEMVNAVAFPGGRILIFEGLLQKAASAEEVAGVVVHEIGHAHHRHGIEGLIRDSAIDAVVSIFAPGAAGDIGATLGSALLSQSYGRDAEREADEFAIIHLNRLNIQSDGMAEFFARIGREQSGRSSSALDYFASHPSPDERSAIIRRDGTGTGTIMSLPDWAALKNICSDVEAE